MPLTESIEGFDHFVSKSAVVNKKFRNFADDELASPVEPMIARSLDESEEIEEESVIENANSDRADNLLKVEQ
jgi:hypothetical protein